MARSPANGEGSVAEQTTLIFPKKSELEELLNTKRQSKKRSQSASGTYSKALASAIEHGHVSRFAFSHAAAFADLDDEKLHVEVFHFIDYLKKMGVMKRAMAQEEMFDEHKADTGALDEAAGGKGGRGGGRRKKSEPAVGATEELPGNVSRLGDHARTVSEQAGGAA